MPRIFETMENNFRLYKIIPLAILKCPVDVSNDLKCSVSGLDELKAVTDFRVLSLYIVLRAEGS